MSAAVHTPGPWRLVGDELYGADGSRIAEAVNARDATLIAAAPEMLEFVRDFVRANEEGVTEEEWAAAIATASAISATKHVLAALKSARDCISQDRKALADAHMDQATNRLDEDGQVGVDEYDAVLAEIDAAIAKATPA